MVLWHGKLKVHSRVKGLGQTAQLQEASSKQHSRLNCSTHERLSSWCDAERLPESLVASVATLVSSSV